MNFDFASIISVLCASLVAAFSLCLCCVHLVGILQQEKYDTKAFAKWYMKKGNMLPRRYSILTIGLVLLTGLVALCFSFCGKEVAWVLSLVPVIGLCVLFFHSEKTYALKVPLKRTMRVTRLAVCFFIMLTLILFGLALALAAIATAIGNDVVLRLCFVPLACAPLLLFPVLMLANLAMGLYENPNNAKIVAAAKEKLSASSAKKVGITGSCGKTSVKAIAEQMLSSKFRVIASEQSYNTPLGVARTVNEKGTEADVLLFEMGARKTGDVSELCDMVQPEYGVVTAVCPQHVETFGSEQAIATEKGVLAQRAKNCVIGATAAQAGVTKEGALVEGVDFKVENVVVESEGTAFDLTLGGKTVSVKTKLLGRQAAENIALASALCLTLGMTVEEIVAAIPSLNYVPHRLQLMRVSGVNILDDAYNCNVIGAQNAVEVLKAFGGRRYIVTPGIVELGALEEEENAKLGASLVGIDNVILIGDTLLQPLKNGYKQAEGDEAKMRTFATLEEAMNELKKELMVGDTVLFMNDLPDLYFN